MLNAFVTVRTIFSYALFMTLPFFTMTSVHAAQCNPEVVGTSNGGDCAYIDANCVAHGGNTVYVIVAYSDGTQNSGRCCDTGNYVPPSTNPVAGQCPAGAIVISNTVTGGVDSTTYQGPHENDDLPGGFSQGLCTFACTGSGSFCPATEPFVFEEISGPDQPLQCQHLNFTGGVNACNQLADQTCEQTSYQPNTNGDSGKVDENGELPPPPPPWVIWPNPGVAIWDFSPQSYDGSGNIEQPYCTFQCTGHGQECPPGFTQTSSENELLTCEDHSFNNTPVTPEHCEQIAEQTCMDTTPNDNTMVWAWNINWNNYTNAVAPMTQAPSTFHVQGVIGPQGENLDSIEYFYNAAVQQLLEKKTTAAVRK